MQESAARPPSPAAEEHFHEADIAFHQALIAATGNRALGGLVERIHSALLLARFPLARPQYRVERALPEHRRILAAVAAGDPAEARRRCATTSRPSASTCARASQTAAGGASAA